MSADREAVAFTFEDEAPTFHGVHDGSRWNGWPVIWVTPAEAERLAAWCDTVTDDHSASELRNAPRDEFGLVELAGFTPTILEEGA